MKIRAAQRAKFGLPLLSVVEVVAGLGLVGLLTASPPTVEAGFRYVVGAVVLVIASSVAMGARFRARRRERVESEGARLVTYVKYLSVSEDPTESEPEGPADPEGA